MSLGQAYVDIHANTAGFKTELASKLKVELEKFVQPVKVTPNTTGFRSELSGKLRAELDKAPIRVKVTPNTTGFRAALAAKLEETAARVKVLPNMTGFRAALRAEMENIVVRVKVVPDLTGFRAALKAELDAGRIAPIVVPVRPGPIRPGAFNPLVGQAGAAGSRITKIFEATSTRIRNLFVSRTLFPSPITLATGFVAAAGAAAFFGLKQASTFDQLNKSFNALQGKVRGLQDGLGRNQLLLDLRRIAEQTSFTFQGAAKLAQQLLGIGKSVPALQLSGERIKQITQIIANAGAAVGATPTAINNLAVVLGKTAGSAKLTARELNSVALAIPTATRAKVFAQLAVDLGLVDKNAKAGSKSLDDAVGKVQKLQTKGLITGPEGFQALVEVLQKLPGATGASARQLTTLGGALTSIKEQIQNRLADAFTGAATKIAAALNDPKINGAINSLVLRIGGASSAFITNFVPVFASALPIIGDIFVRISQGLVSIGPRLIAVADAAERGITAIGAKFDQFRAFLGSFDINAVALRSNIEQLVGTLKDLPPIIGEIARTVTVFAGAVNLALTPFTALLHLVAELLGTPVGKIFVAAGTAAAIAAVATGVYTRSLAALTLATRSAITATLALDAATVATTGSFVVGALRMGQFSVALQALRGAMVGATLSTGGFVALLAAAGTTAFLVGEKLGGLVVRALGLQGALASAAPAANAFTASLNGVIANGSTASQAMANLRAQIGAIPTGIDIVVRDNASGVAQRFAVLSSALAAFRAANPDLVKFDKTSLELAFLRSQQEKTKGLLVGPILPGTTRPVVTPPFKLPNIPTAPAPTTGGTGGTSGGGSSAAQTAAQKAQAAADAFREAIRQILEKLDANFKDTLVNGTTKAIHSALASLETEIKAAFKGRKTTLDDTLVASIEKSNAKLQKLAVERDSVLDRLQKAQARAAEVVSSVAQFANITSVDFAKSVTAAAATVTKLNTATLDVAGSFRVVSRTLEQGATSADAAVTHTAKDFAAGLKARLTAINTFQTEIQALIKKGLNKSTIDQIIGAGVDSGGPAAAALSTASASTIKAINKTQAAIEKAGAKLGNTAADSLFRSGKSVVDGLIAGLKDKKSEIAKAMNDIATTLIATLRKKLKIASPSGVMRALFGHVGTGAVLGLQDSMAPMAAAAERLARASLPRLAPVSTSDLAGRAEMGALRQLGARSGGPDLGDLVAAIQGARAVKEIHAPQTFNVDARGMSEAQLRSALNARASRLARR